MIVQEPPFELIVLFPDSEMKMLVEALIERGQRGRDCTRPFRWLSIRDPRRDTVWREPDRPLMLFLRMNCCFLIVWDHQGSGIEAQQPAEVEVQVIHRLTGLGVPRERILAVAFDPELEVSFRMAWSKIKRVVAEERRMAPPADPFILEEAQRRNPRLRIPDDFGQALARHPKELFEALIRLLRLRRSPPLYAKIGERVSLRALKGEGAVARIANAIATWFPPVAHE